MKCACPECGALMEHTVRKGKPCCVCLYCLRSCDICLGGGEMPKQKNELLNELESIIK